VDSHASRTKEKISAVKGTRDILPPDSSLWQAVERKAHEVFGTFGYMEIRNPVIEPAELFVRSIGEGTDIVNKEMYIFQDRKGRSICLRPEGTASVARAYIEHGLRVQPHPQRLYYLGPMFRYERPQKGRYRQFHQIGAEILGSETPEADVEMLTMVHDYLKVLHFEHLRVLLNSVGCDVCRPPYRKILIHALDQRKEDLCEDCRSRITVNPLRVMDCKTRGCQAVVTQLPPMVDHLCDECRIHHGKVLEGLDRAGVAYERNDRLVRGLDYYTRTVFEVVSEDLGAQNAMLGGGRYNRLIEELGGPTTPGVGFAIGQDRLVDILPNSFRDMILQRELYYLVPSEEKFRDRAGRIARVLRSSGHTAIEEVDGRSFKAAAKFADRTGITFTIFLGESEASEDSITIKNMKSGEQISLKEELFHQRIKGKLSLFDA